MRIGDLIGRRVVEGCLFGVEIEVEGAGLPRKVAGCDVVKEGSLRPVQGEDGKEYVFTMPQPYEASLTILTNLCKKLEDSPILQFSNRTSVHVHVNVLDLTVSEWFTFLFLWVVYEDALINFCGNERKGNLFCLSSRDAEGLMFALEDFAINGALGKLDDEVRYCAVNTAATNKYGSVEFRAMRGTSDIGVLASWLDTLRSMREMAVKLGSPKALIEQLLVEPEQFTRHLFPEGHFVYDYPDLRRSVLENVFRCAVLVDTCNFDKFSFIDEPYNDI